MTREEAIKGLKYLVEYDDYGSLHTDEIKMAIQALQEQIVWHPYPKEKPTEDGRYLVTIRMFCRDGFDEEYERRFVQEDVFDLGYFWKAGVIAWAELPKPYEEGVDNE